LCPPELASKNDSFIQTGIIIVLGLVLLGTLFPQKAMDILDAYMELPYLSMGVY
jgi:hypothetical protein